MGPFMWMLVTLTDGEGRGYKTRGDNLRSVKTELNSKLM